MDVLELDSHRGLAWVTWTTCAMPKARRLWSHPRYRKQAAAVSSADSPARWRSWDAGRSTVPLAAALPFGQGGSFGSHGIAPISNSLCGPSSEPASDPVIYAMASQPALKVPAVVYNPIWHFVLLRGFRNCFDR